MNRREFLLTSAAMVLAPTVSWSKPVHWRKPAIRLRAEPVTARILPEGYGLTRMLGLNGSTPGPEIRIRQGHRMSVAFENGLDQGSALHWHGIHIDNAMDGVPNLTQAVVESGDTFNYTFAVPHAGTYWYHSHNRSWEQVAKGLYGPLIIEERIPPPVNHDITVILDDWRLGKTGEMHGDFGNRHDFSHSGRLGNLARALVSRNTVRHGDRVRLRLINAATARNFTVKIDGGTGKTVAYDGMPVPEPAPLGDLLLAPAQRTDVILDVTGPIAFILRTRRGLYELGTIAAKGSNSMPIDAPIAPLPPAGVQQPDRSKATDLTLVMQGGAMGGRHRGNDIWAFNDHSDLPDAPWRRFARGETVRIRLRNDTAFPHGIHIHGHHFHEIQDDGSIGRFRDTTMVMPRQGRDILCVFDNPGRWLLHCHTLGHSASGMRTWVEVL